MYRIQNWGNLLKVIPAFCTRSFLVLPVVEEVEKQQVQAFVSLIVSIEGGLAAGLILIYKFAEVRDRRTASTQKPFEVEQLWPTGNFEHWISLPLF